jgi:hypothetical protein
MPSLLPVLSSRGRTGYVETTGDTSTLEDLSVLAKLRSDEE